MGDRDVRRLPMFPLGSVLMPAGIMPLHIFEPRYLALMDDLTGAELGTPIIAPEFGIVGIRRGHEVGGGDLRSSLGTLTRLIDARRLPDGHWVVLAEGVGRIDISDWLPDDPYPLALVSDVVEVGWDPRNNEALGAAKLKVGSVIAMAVELGDVAAATELSWSSDPLEAAWQVCAVAPVGPLDQQRLLEADSVATRLALLAEQLVGVEEVFAFRLSGG